MYLLIDYMSTANNYISEKHVLGIFANVFNVRTYFNIFLAAHIMTSPRSSQLGNHCNVYYIQVIGES